MLDVHKFIKSLFNFHLFSVRREAPKKKATPEQQEKRFEAAVKIVPGSFNTSIMCIGSEIGGIGACEGDDGGPGYVFDTGNNLNEEKFVQVI
jgi:hypothetical protein